MVRILITCWELGELRVLAFGMKAWHGKGLRDNEIQYIITTTMSERIFMYTPLSGETPNGLFIFVLKIEVRGLEE